MNSCMKSCPWIFCLVLACRPRENENRIKLNKMFWLGMINQQNILIAKTNMSTSSPTLSTHPPIIIYHKSWAQTTQPLCISETANKSLGTKPQQDTW